MKTYRKWLKKGRQVRRGEKAVDFSIKGKALFKKSQTKKTLDPRYYESLYDDFKATPYYQGDVEEWEYENFGDWGDR